MKLVAFDIETSGSLPEYALQPQRAVSGDAWLTSCVAAFPNGRTVGKLRPTVDVS